MLVSEMMVQLNLSPAINEAKKLIKRGLVLLDGVVLADDLELSEGKHEICRGGRRPATMEFDYKNEV